MSDERSGRATARRVLTLSAFATLLANLAGAVVVFVLVAFVLPLPPLSDESGTILVNLIVASGYAGVAALVGAILVLRDARRRLGWLVEERQPSGEERRRTLRIPLAATLRQLLFWALAAVMFAVFNGLSSVLLGIEIGITIVIAGLTTAVTTFLLQQRIGHPLVARALRGTTLRQAPGAGVGWRTVLTWALGTGLPVAGLTLLAGLSLGLDITRRELAVATFVLGLTGLCSGLLSILIHARGLAHPLQSLRRTLEAIEQGDLDTDVEITDTSEVGVLQSGVNRMLEGLRERDRLHDLFGRHVGGDVARRALEEGAELGGEERTVAALFVDVVDSTSLAEQTEPAEVLRLLNDFFAVVIDVVDRHDGTINKFLGDGVLAIWGAPLQHDDPVTAALRAARELGRRLPREVDALRAGVGVAAGPVVAGNVGASQRLEYTVIGDPVNVASRLSDQAKQRTGRVLADADMLARAAEEEVRCWAQVGTTTLRGKEGATTLAEPAA